MSDDKKANNDPISQALNMIPMDNSRDNVLQLIEAAADESAKTDFSMARDNLHRLIQSGTVSLERLTEIAAQSQHPRAFEVLANMINTLVNANKELLELQTKIREINAADGKGPAGGPQVINNNLFVGSTQELLKTLKSINPKQLDDDTAD